MPQRFPSLRDYTEGPLAGFLSGSPVLDIGVAPPPTTADGGHAAVFAPYQLQTIADYRAALQRWFAAVRTGGYLVVVVPHAFLHDRQNALPARWDPEQRRLYTPRLLLGEIEEALAPNSYRLRWLGDDDRGYDYALDPDRPPVGHCDIVAVLEKIAPPAWDLDRERNPAKRTPGFAFEPPRTRVERARTSTVGKVLIVKLDHLGDFIMGIPALERARQAFPDAAITLVVGSWNHAMATDLGLFDEVLAFDVFPRNSSEEKVDVPGKTALFDALVTASYDLAIDLRTDDDTRFLLRNVRARIKAGLGTRARFDFLDVFLPVDNSRHDVEAARDEEIPARDFQARRFCTRNRFQIACKGKLARGDDGAIIWGPYRSLPPGRYIFEPFIEVESDTPGLLRFDIAVDREPKAEGVLSELSDFRLAFTTDAERGLFEFRLWTVDGEPVPDFTFHGGRLIKQGASSVLHQSEYLALLIELVALRVNRYGLLGEQPVRP